jgi:hypothetical protein
MLFGVTFAIFYLLWEPSLRLSRSLALAMFNLSLGIVNEQTYDFAHYANMSTSIILTLSVAIAIPYMFGSPRPEKAFLRLLNRFFRYGEYLMAHLVSHRKRRRGWAVRWKTAFYLNNLALMPEKLATQDGQIDHRLFSGNTPEQVQTMVQLSEKPFLKAVYHLIPACFVLLH